MGKISPDLCRETAAKNHVTSCVKFVAILANRESWLRKSINRWRNCVNFRRRSARSDDVAKMRFQPSCDRRARLWALFGGSLGDGVPGDVPQRMRTASAVALLRMRVRRPESGTALRAVTRGRSTCVGTGASFSMRGRKDARRFVHHGARCTRPSSRRIPFRDCIARLPEAPSRAAWHHVAQSRKAFSRSEGTWQQASAVYGCLLLWARCARCDVRPGREWADGLRHVIAIAYLAYGRGGTVFAKPVQSANAVVVFFANYRGV